MVIGLLAHRWQQLLPEHPDLGLRLLTRWSEPSRHYHGLEHLAECLDALDVLGASARAERLALWFHDAVHANQAGADERHSAALAEQELAEAGLATAERAEVSRLILLTIEHRATLDDHPGARICDADLAILAAPRSRYDQSVRQLRAERPELDDRGWQISRRRRVAELLARNPLYLTAAGRERWQESARVNLAAEARQLSILESARGRG